MNPVTQKTVQTLDPVQLSILQEVAGAPNCTITHVVVQLLNSYSENNVRSGVRNLLNRRLLDGGKSTNGILLRITSNGRVALDRALTGTIR